MTQSLLNQTAIGSGAGWHPEPIDKLDLVAALEDAQNELAPIQHLMPLVRPGTYERKLGRVITIALAPPCNSPAYAYNVAKAARADAALLARDSAWPHGVTANTIASGPVPALESLDTAIEQCAHGPAWHNGSTASPQAIAEAVVFLCSAAASFISGAMLPFLYR